MKPTENYGLALYEKEDKFDITGEENSLNSNMKKIDKTLGEIKKITGELENLSTEDKTNLVKSINELFVSMNNPNIIEDKYYQENKFYMNTVGTSTINDIKNSSSGQCIYGIYKVNDGDTVYTTGRGAGTHYLYDTDGVLRAYRTGSVYKRGFNCSVEGYKIGYFGITEQNTRGAIKGWTVPSMLKTSYLSAYTYAIDSTNYEEMLPDLDTASINKVYSIMDLQNIANIPQTSANAATMIYFNGDTTRETNTNKTFGVQILVTINEEVFVRSCWANKWRSWKNINMDINENDIIEKVKKSTIVPNFTNFSAFSKFGVIGDSLSVGALTGSDGEGVINKDNSWGAFISKNCHNEVLHLGFSGATTTSWLETETYGRGLHTALMEENKCNAYIIGLGYNDNNPAISSGQVPLGSISDINVENEDNNVVSYYGNMDKILRKLHKAYPNAQLFVLTNPYYNTTYAESYNTAVRDVCNNLGVENNVHLIDLYELYKDIYISFEADREDNHYHKQLYYYMGMLIATAISNYMLENYKIFKYINE